MGFVYESEMFRDVENFDNYPELEKIEIERHIIQVINESFVLTGDQDYLAARIFAKNKMFRSFFWSASQAIEKYLKAYLLLNGCSVKNYNHNICKLFDKAVELNKNIIQMDWDFCISEEYEKYQIDFIEKINVKDFLKIIYEVGNPDSRYNGTEIEYKTGYLFSLDRFAYNFRDSKKLICFPPVKDSFEKIDVNLVDLFHHGNPLFGGRGVEAICLSVAVTTLERLHVGVAPNSRVILNWLEGKMMMPKK